MPEKTRKEVPWNKFPRVSLDVPKEIVLGYMYLLLFLRRLYP